MFWMATLNPGKKRGRRKKLTPWQQMVKRHGGVMQAVRAKRRGKRTGKRKVGGRRRRKLSAWNLMVKKYGGVKGAVKARKSLRHRHTHKFGWNAKSAMKRSRSRRRRGGKRHGRRSIMARSRTRRKSRRVRRNAWHGAPRKHRAAALKGWRKRRKSGRVHGRRHRKGGRRRRVSQVTAMRRWAASLGSGGFKRNGRRKRKYRRNSVVPVSWNPRRRRARSRRKYRRNGVLPISWNPRRRRARLSYRRNGVLPISWNPVAAIGSAPAAILGQLKEFINPTFWIETGIPTVAGFGLSKSLGNKLYDFASGYIPVPAQVAPYARIASQALAGSALAYGVKRFGGAVTPRAAKIAQGIWLGTVVNVAFSFLQLVLPTQVKDFVGLSGVGDSLNSRMRDAIRAKVNGNMNGMGRFGTYLKASNMIPQRGNVGEYVTENALRAQGGYAPGPTASIADLDVGNPGPSF